MTSVPGLLQPQTGSGISRCRTALSENGVPSSMVGLGCATSSAAFTVKGEINRHAARANREYLGFIKWLADGMVTIDYFLVG